MIEITTMGLDIAKHVFQVHGVDGCGVATLRRKLRRSEVLSFFRGIEPCLCWAGSLCHGPLLGAGVDSLGSRSPADGCDSREALGDAVMTKKRRPSTGHVLANR